MTKSQIKKVLKNIENNGVGRLASNCPSTCCLGYGLNREGESQLGDIFELVSDDKPTVDGIYSTQTVKNAGIFLQKLLKNLEKQSHGANKKR